MKSFEEFKILEKKNIHPINIKELILKNRRQELNYVIDTIEDDTNGDGIPDKIILLGKDYTGGESNYKTNIYLEIIDGATNKKTTINFPNNEGYNSCLFLANFRNLKEKDILVRITSGGSGDYLFAYIVSFIENQYKIVFDSENYFKKEDYNGKFKDSYKVELVSNILKEKYSLDISNKEKDYLNLIYEGEKLKNPMEVNVSSLNSLIPLNQCNDNIYNLLSFQKLLGINYGDLLGVIESYIKWDNKGFKTYFQLLGLKGV
ncbi:hypothetical protein [Clostridium fallax]|uniref:Uncharacterized protein n=1 Tax=Clostridium fallax TaxID=1533 RepID=A0A1M4WAR9_9CLOT|nr:hypothetical protein [Clostridium fallax]SHE78265.1 hypothetical protein SAMN05443638_11141 [Clostridium fallax]SQB05923.1 Uncharacterised protein [Clostridium fallax]